MWKVPGWWLITATSPQIDIPIRIRYSIKAMPTWVRAVMRIPTTEITSMMTPTALPMATHAQGLVLAEPKTARIDGPSKRISATVPMMYATTMNHPVRKPRYGLIARPTHSNDAPQFAFHMLHRREALAITSMGIAVRMRIGPLP